MTKITEIQEILGVEADGEWGSISQAALDKAKVEHVLSRFGDGWTKVKASSFADPADVAAFRRCKNNGGSDQQCFKVGDSGEGYWERDCTDMGENIVALPPEIWKPIYGSRAADVGVQVRYRGKIYDCILGDTMPHLANITNGCGIDLAPGLVSRMGLTPPVEEEVEWRWKI